MLTRAPLKGKTAKDSSPMKLGLELLGSPTKTALV